MKFTQHCSIEVVEMVDVYAVSEKIQLAALYQEVSWLKGHVLLRKKWKKKKRKAQINVLILACNLLLFGTRHYLNFEDMILK